MLFKVNFCINDLAQTPTEPPRPSSKQDPVAHNGGSGKCAGGSLTVTSRTQRCTRAFTDDRVTSEAFLNSHSVSHKPSASEEP